MIAALLLGLGTFLACWMLHVLIWRIHRPVAYPVWLPVIFVLCPFAAAIALYVLRGAASFPCDLFTGVAACLLHLVISACYMGGYAGIIEYSPSAEILRVVRASVPTGVRPEELEVTSLTEQALTGKRIQHLFDSGMAELNDGNISLTPKGHRFVALCNLYRRAFGLREVAKG